MLSNDSRQADSMGELTARRINHYPVQISGTCYRFGWNWSRNWILKSGRISSQLEPDIRYIAIR